MTIGVIITSGIILYAILGIFVPNILSIFNLVYNDMED